MCVVVWYETGSVGAESGWSDNTLKRRISKWGCAAVSAFLPDSATIIQHGNSLLFVCVAAVLTATPDQAGRSII